MGRPYPAQYFIPCSCHSADAASSSTCTALCTASLNSHPRDNSVNSSRLGLDMTQNTLPSEEGLPGDSRLPSQSSVVAQVLSRLPSSSDTVVDHGAAAYQPPEDVSLSGSNFSDQEESSITPGRLTSLSVSDREEWLRQSGWRFLRRERDGIEADHDVSEGEIARRTRTVNATEEVNSGINEQPYSPIALAIPTEVINESSLQLESRAALAAVRSTINELSLPGSIGASDTSTLPFSWLGELSRRTPLIRPRSTVVLGELLSRTPRTQPVRAGVGRNTNEITSRSPETEEVLRSARHALRTAVGFAERLEEVTRTLTRLTESAAATATLEASAFSDRELEVPNRMQRIGELRPFPRSASISLARSIASLRAASARIDDVLGETENVTDADSVAPHPTQSLLATRTVSADEASQQLAMSLEQANDNADASPATALSVTGAQSIRERSRRRLQALSSDLSYPYPHERGSIISRHNVNDTLAAPSATAVHPFISVGLSSSNPAAISSTLSHSSSTNDDYGRRSGRHSNALSELISRSLPYSSGPLGTPAIGPDASGHLPMSVTEERLIAAESVNAASEAARASFHLVNVPTNLPTSNHSPFSASDASNTTPFASATVYAAASSAENARLNERQWRWTKLDRNGDVVEHEPSRGNAGSRHTRDLIGR